MPNKPFPYKAYGSIPHVKGSKLTFEDKDLNQGQSDILTGKPRPGDNIIVQIKLDGSCCAVTKKQGRVIPLQRTGYEASSSIYEQHQMFARFVNLNYDIFDFILSDGERLVGEWLYKTHSIKYKFSNDKDFRLFSIFDLFNERNERVHYKTLKYRVQNTPLILVPFVQENSVSSVEDLKPLLHFDYGYSPVEKHEGFVFRCETETKVDFLGKYVREDFIPGKYLDSDTLNF